jgi:beta-carotene hydroxylase
VGKSDQLDRRAIARAGKYMGNVAWPTVILAVVLATSYIAAVALALAGILSLWIAVPLVAVITYLSYTILHDSVHGSIGGNDRSLRWLNKAMGYIAAWITMIPLTAHRYEHMAHHRYANDPERDPDFHMGSMADSPLASVRAALHAWGHQFIYYARNHWADAPLRQNVILCLEVAAALAPRLALILSGYWIEGVALFFVAWIMGAIILLYLFAYIVHRPHDQVGRYRDTSTILPPESPLLRTGVNWCWMFQNYHSMHHLFPRVPFYKYADLYDEIEDVLEAKQAPIYGMSLQGLRRVTTRPTRARPFPLS